MNALEQFGRRMVTGIKEQSWFPFKSGKLRSNATSGNMINENTYVITFDSQIAPYVEYLEEGTREHDIPHAFGYGTYYADRPNPYTHEIPFGVGGRFNGKFHPGSTKHKGFISNKAVGYILNNIRTQYKGVLK